MESVSLFQNKKKLYKRSIYNKKKENNHRICISILEYEETLQNYVDGDAYYHNNIYCPCLSFYVVLYTRKFPLCLSYD